MTSLKVAFNLSDGHISQGRSSHAEMLRSAREWDDNVRAIIFPEKKAVYFRFYAPSYDGLEKPTEDQEDESFKAADKALTALVKAGLVKKSWKALYWNVGKVLSPFDIRL